MLQLQTLNLKNNLRQHNAAAGMISRLKG